MAIRETLLANIPGINVQPKVIESVVPPAVFIRTAPDLDYFHTFGNSSTPWQFDLLVVTGADVEFAQDPLDELVDARGDKSIVRVLLDNQTLGRTDCSLNQPLRLSHYGTLTFGQTPYTGATIRIGVVVTHA